MMRVAGGLYGRLFLLLLLGLGGLLASCQTAAETEPVAQAESLCNLPIPEIETMNSTENKDMALHKYDVPPIDAAAPARTMTATFSLG
jgi:hypothetical protein